MCKNRKSYIYKSVKQVRDASTIKKREREKMTFEIYFTTLLFIYVFFVNKIDLRPQIHHLLFLSFFKSKFNIYFNITKVVSNLLFFLFFIVIFLVVVEIYYKKKIITILFLLLHQMLC